jgi:hypothetical protein
MEKVTQKSHELTDGVLTRVWSFAANVKVPDFAKRYVTRDMLRWDQISTYRLKDHEGEWHIDALVKPEWKKYFSSSGTYTLEARGDGSARIVRGELDLRVRVVRSVVERLIVNEVKKTFEAEAATLRELATLV